MAHWELIRSAKCGEEYSVMDQVLVVAVIHFIEL